MKQTTLPSIAEFQKQLDNGETLSFEFNGAGGSQSFWQSHDTHTPGHYVRSTAWYTPKVYPNITQAYNALKRMFKLYGTKKLQSTPPVLTSENGTFKSMLYDDNSYHVTYNVDEPKTTLIIVDPSGETMMWMTAQVLFTFDEMAELTDFINSSILGNQ